MTTHKNGDQHPTEPGLFFSSRSRKFVTISEFEAEAAEVAKRKVSTAGILRTANRRTRAQSGSSRHHDEIRRLTKRGKSVSYIMTVCNVPASVVLAAQESA